MATLTFSGGRLDISLNATLNNVPAGANTYAALLAKTTSGVNDDDVMGVRGGNMSGSYYHGFVFGNEVSYDVYDDNGITFSHMDTNIPHTGTTANDFYISALNWASGDVLDRAHFSTKITGAGTFTHVDADATNGGVRAGPGAGTGFFHVGDYDTNPFDGCIGLVGVWVGVKLTDGQIEALITNKKTSDWWNSAAGHPDTLIELTSTTMTDIGANPVSTITVNGSVAATGANPTGWTFDGRGSVVVTDTTTRRYQTRRSRMTSW